MKEGNAGACSLANVLGNMAARKAERPLVLDFGVIQSDYSLKTNTFGPPIPHGEYSVCRCVTYDPSVPLTQSYNDGVHGHPGASPPGVHTHDIVLPEKMHWIKPGNRVLVAWVDNEAVVIDLVYSSSRVG